MESRALLVGLRIGSIVALLFTWWVGGILIDPAGTHTYRYDHRDEFDDLGS